MDIHLRIDTDLAWTIEIDLHTNADTASAAAYLDCRRYSYEEIGGEGFNASRRYTRHTLGRETLDEVQRFLPKGPLATPSNVLSGIDGTTFTLTIGRGASAAEYSWWSRPPAEWEGLREIVRLLVTAADVDAYVHLHADYFCVAALPPDAEG